MERVFNFSAGPSMLPLEVLEKAQKRAGCLWKRRRTKNIGPAGFYIVIVRDDLIGNAIEGTPTMMDYKAHADNDSMYNTPPTFSIYISALVFEWIKERGGVAAMQKINEEKAALIYDFLDNAKLLKGTVVPKDRSLMNVTFVTGSEELIRNS
ncbi:phosphoserine aminotransferase [Holotrichia oblita]|nr:phosphoserine aminotransferase [Holotrichia oblita]